MTTSQWILSIFLTGGALLVFIFYNLYVDRSQEMSDLQLLAEAEAALDQKRYSDTLEIACRVSETSKHFADAVILVSKAVEQRAGCREAIRVLEEARLPSRNPGDAHVWNRLAELQISSGMIDSALRSSKHACECDEFNTVALRRLAQLNGMVGRPWASQEYYWPLLQSGAMTLNELAVFADVERPIDAEQQLLKWHQLQPDDPIVRLGLLVHRNRHSDSDEILEELRLYVKEYPESLTAQMMLGRRLLESGSPEVHDWHVALPSMAESHPECWLLRSRWYRQDGDLKAAANCCWHALQLSPTSRAATSDLAQLLNALDHPQADSVRNHAERLYSLGEHLDRVLTSADRDDRTIQSITLLLIDSGRYWEAAGWAVISERLFANRTWPGELRRLAVSKVSPLTDRVDEPLNLSHSCDLSVWNSHRTPIASAKVQPQTGRLLSGDLRFSDQHIGFRYLNSADPATPGARMFEITGGGLGVVDFDMDCWPDLFFPQGGKWPDGAKQPPREFSAFDEIHRNERGLTFRPVIESGLNPGGFGQGCSVGDYNSDGLPDLFVANIGRNQLYQNMGDGTFQEVTAAAGFHREDWTTSSAFVDLNSDGLPDLYEVNYVSSDDVYVRICQSFACSPLEFDGTPDRVLLNLGNGQFLETPDTIPQSGTKGLGVVACTIGASNSIGLFVSNDQVSNSYLVAQPLPESEIAAGVPGVRLKEQALTSGLAYSEDGIAMACMGIAAADIGHDGRIDFLVTNFRHEPNTFYSQDVPNLFVDSSRASGLKGPGIPYVGWGTQFLDADNDGLQDLVVVNGHVDNYPESEGGYAMPAQFYRNTGSRFDVVASDSGRFFTQKMVGRSVVRLDWNCDGRQDFAVGTLESPYRLVTNKSNGGNWVRVRLAGREGHQRDVGTRVTLSIAQEQYSQQLTAGDGYLASNERVIHFGVGPAECIDVMRVHWPDGSSALFKNLATNCTYTLTEERLVKMPR